MRDEHLTATRSLRRPSALGARTLFMAAVFAAASIDALAALPAHAQGKRPPAKEPLMLETYKSFFVGGERFTREDGTVGLSGHAYVEAFIPYTPGEKRPPIVMTHSGISGTIWLQRANGEEGWALLFVRAGYPVYVVEPPGTGRAGINLELLTDLSQVTQGSSESWVDWRHGPEFGELGFLPDSLDEADATPHPVPMNQMPTDEEGVNQFLGHRMVYRAAPPGTDPIEDPVRDAAFIALMEKIGEPVIWMGWSRGGLLGQRLATQRPDLFKAIAFVEGCTVDLPTPEAWQAFLDTVVSHRIPMLQINPDYARDVSDVGAVGQFLPSGSRCVQPVDVAAEIRARGGNARTIYLPDVGIFGNGHEYMLQNNADRIARVYLRWLRANVR